MPGARPPSSSPLARSLESIELARREHDDDDRGHPDPGARRGHQPRHHDNPHHAGNHHDPGSPHHPDHDARAQAQRRTEPVDVNKIVRAVSRCCVGLADVDAMRVATKTISGLYDGATTRELDQLSIQTAAGADRRGAAVRAGSRRGCWPTYIDKEVRGQEIHVVLAVDRASASAAGLIDDATGRVRRRQRAQAQRRDRRRARPRVRVLRPAHGLRPLPAEAPADAAGHRDAAAVLPARRLRAGARRVAEALELYRLFSSLEYLPSSPTLFNAGTRHEQLSSCFLLDSPADDLEAIYERYTDVALLSKFSGGIGLAYHRVRSRGSLIEAPTATPTASCRGSRRSTPRSRR